MSSWCWCVASSVTSEAVLMPERPGGLQGLTVRESFLRGQTDSHATSGNSPGYVKRFFEGHGRSHPKKGRKAGGIEGGWHSNHGACAPLGNPRLMSTMASNPTWPRSFCSDAVSEASISTSQQSRCELVLYKGELGLVLMAAWPRQESLPSGTL